MYYIAVKHLHMTCVVISGLFFALRGIWMMQSPHLLQQRWVKTVPHIVDTGLLGSAVYLSSVSFQYPWVFSWLTAKVCALLLYIVLGSMALKRGKTLALRKAFYVAALLTYIYIVSVALNKNPAPFISP